MLQNVLFVMFVVGLIPSVWNCRCYFLYFSFAWIFVYVSVMYSNPFKFFSNQISYQPIFIWTRIIATTKNPAITVYIATLALFLGTLGAARNLHNSTLNRIMRAPMATFFDVTPAGRIINRMSHDVDEIDNDFPATLRAWVSCLFSVYCFQPCFCFLNYYRHYTAKIFPKFSTLLYYVSGLWTLSVVAVVQDSVQVLCQNRIHKIH